VKTVRARWKLVAAATVAVTLTAVVLALTAWNSSGSGASNSAAGDREQAMLDFAQCMRENGVPSFPDPVTRPDGTFGFERPTGVPTSAIDAAIDKCQAELEATGLPLGPQSGQDTEMQDALLEFSRCMRANGVAEFPDPKPSKDAIGALHGLFDGIDQQSPRVQRAMQSCQSVLNQALSGLHGG
jgi:hypothetical protein